MSIENNGCSHGGGEQEGLGRDQLQVGGWYYSSLESPRGKILWGFKKPRKLGLVRELIVAPWLLPCSMHVVRLALVFSR